MGGPSVNTAGGMIPFQDYALQFSVLPPSHGFFWILVPYFIPYYFVGLSREIFPYLKIFS